MADSLCAYQAISSRTDKLLALRALEPKHLLPTSTRRNILSRNVGGGGGKQGVICCAAWQNFELAIFGTKHKSLLKYTDAVIPHIKRRSSQLDKDFEFQNWDLVFSVFFFFYCSPQSQLKKFISPNASRRETHATMRGLPQGEAYNS